MVVPTTSPLLAPGELRERLGEVTVLDVRWRLGGPPGAEEYAAGHVPGAAYVDLDTELAGGPGGGRHPLPTPAAFQAAMRRAGVHGDRPVVVYDDWSAMAAARCWWLLRHFGHDDVRVLDGGWSAWQAAGGAVETGTPPVEPGDFTAGPGRLPTLEAEEVQEVARTGTLLDARAGERYRGEVEPVDPVAGHVPGALNLPTADNVAADGRLRPARELRERFATVVGEGPVGVYCGSGVTATHQLLAMAVAGLDGMLYPGSWSEWVSDPSRPVATGSQPG